jgi:hypothetical protein
MRKLGEACTLDRIHNKGSALPYVGLEDIVAGTGATAQLLSTSTLLVLIR